MKNNVTGATKRPSHCIVVGETCEKSKVGKEGVSTHLWVAIVLIDEVKDILKPWVGSHRGECEGVVIDGYGGVGIEGYGGGYGGEVGNRNGRVRKVVCMVTGIDEVGIGNGCCNHVWSW